MTIALSEGQSTEAERGVGWGAGVAHDGWLASEQNLLGPLAEWVPQFKL